MFLRRIPLRKLCVLLKLCLFAAIISSVIIMLQMSSGDRRGSNALLAKYSSQEIKEFEKQIEEDLNKIQDGLGEGGEMVELAGEDAVLGKESEKKLAMNVYLSDRIPYDRNIKDYRHPKCNDVMYDAELPSVSVIIIFHNEPYSVLVRTIWSVLNSLKRSNPYFKKAHYGQKPDGTKMKLGYPGQNSSSPYVYLKEIILVDDSSTLPELKGKLDYYIDTRMPRGVVKVIRLPKRSGLVVARVIGSRAAKGSVLVFLDAHIETVADWLRPLLRHIDKHPTSVLCPVIDIIDQGNFGLDAVGNIQVGGFNFAGHFTWMDIPERLKKWRKNEIDPVPSPTMAGGLFAIDRKYYWQSGAYDEQMQGWGGENLEMSFRIWQCGGTLEVVPCSRVGHVFRSFHPYGMPGSSDTHGINTARMAEVWMDEYKELYYLNRADLRNSPKIGDITHRRVLRDKLGCRSFQWYLDNVYPEKFVPVRDTEAYGRFRNPHTHLCLDSLQLSDSPSPLGVYSCHTTLLPSQYYMLSLRGELRSEELCAQVRYIRDDNAVDEKTSRDVYMVGCHGKQKDQLWRSQPTGQLVHVKTGLCLDAYLTAGEHVKARQCDENSLTQIWSIEFSKETNYGRKPGVNMTEREQNLQKIRYSRNTTHMNINRALKSRRAALKKMMESSEKQSKKRNKRDATKMDLPMLSLSNTRYRETKRSRNHNVHKRNGEVQRKREGKKSNKFVIEIRRTLPNKTEEHLEVDITCKHTKLYPNNSFVRDLVQLLNKNDISVINNGKIFDKFGIRLLKINKTEPVIANTSIKNNTVEKHAELIYGDKELITLRKAFNSDVAKADMDKIKMFKSKINKINELDAKINATSEFVSNKKIRKNVAVTKNFDSIENKDVKNTVFEQKIPPNKIENTDIFSKSNLNKMYPLELKAIGITKDRQQKDVEDRFPSDSQKSVIHSPKSLLDSERADSDYKKDKNNFSNKPQLEYLLQKAKEMNDIYSTTTLNPQISYIDASSSEVSSHSQEKKIAQEDETKSENSLHSEKHSTETALTDAKKHFTYSSSDSSEGS